MKNNNVKLTPYQALFYYEWLQAPLRDDYNMVMDSIITGDLCIQKFNDSVVKMVNEHFVYSHNPSQEDDGFYWKPRVLAESVVTYHPNSLSESEIYAIVSTPFNLEEDLLFKVDIIKLGEQRYRMIMVSPHITIDGLTTHELYEKLSAGYNKVGYETYPTEEQVRMHHGLNEFFDKILIENKQKIHNFWAKHLDELTGVDLAFLKSNIVKKKNTLRYVSEYMFSYDEDVASRIKSLKHDYRITPYIFGQLVLAVLLNKISGQKNIALTYPIAILEGSDYIFGAHVNSMVIDYRFKDDTTLCSLIDHTLNFFKELKISKGKYLPVQEITQYAANSSVLEIGFAQTFLRDVAIDLDGTKLEKINHDYQIDLVHKLLFEQEQHEGRINYRVKYDKDVLDEKLVGDFVALYQKLSEEILDDLTTGNGNKKTKSYQLVDKEQYNAIVKDWNENQVPYSSDKTAVQVFEEQAAKRPDNIALVYEDTRLTYHEFNIRANRLAHYLINTYKIKSGDLIGLCLDKSEHMLVAIMGVLKAGAAYVPMDPTMPDERIEYMMSDASAKVLLTSAKYKIRFENLPLGLEVVDDYTHLQKLVADSPVTNPVTTTCPNDLIYVMYTSGTTGKPKGVMVEHRNVNRLVINTNFVSINETDNVLSLSGYQFDGSTYDFFQPLLNGASLVLASKNVFLDLERLNELIEKEQITNFYITTALFNSITDAKLSNLKNVKYIIFGGEEASITHVRKFKQNFENVILVDGYGPTETTTFAVTYRVDSDATEFAKNIPIGYPIANTTTYILDENMDVLPIGSIGELYIGGAGVARGYLNNPELTSQKFLKNPFQTEAQKLANYNGTIYKTGDLVRYLPDGSIDYIGRNDFQVKIRGFRIELGEIECALLSYPKIRQSVVLAKDRTSGIKYLVGYYVADEKLDETEIRNYLAESLPDFMIPSVLIHLREFPLTINGKVDQRALPEPVLTDCSNYVAPKSELERKLCDIYGELLGIESSGVSVTDDFYKLGGNSIQVIKLTGRINKALGCKIQVANIFNNRTIRSLVNLIDQGQDQDESIAIAKSNITNFKDQLLSFAQQRLWFIESYEGGSSAYNIPMIFEIKEKVDIDCLKEAIHKIVHRHEVLRSLIKVNDQGIGYQIVVDDKKQPLLIEEENFKTREELNAAIKQSVKHIFTLESNYPIYVKIYKLGEYTYMSIVIHHIAFDGWSTELFIKELFNYYKYYEILKSGDSKQALQYELPEIAIQYRDFALWQRKYLAGDVLDKQLNYWKTQLSGYETLNLATDKVRPLQIDYTGADIDFDLDVDLSTQLRNVAKELNVSMYNLLLSGYYLLLSAYSNQEDIVLASPIAGRNHQQIADTIGFFVNTLALRQTVDSNQSLIDLIKKVANTSANAQNNQDLPFEKLVEELHIDKDTSRYPIAQVMFGVQSFANEQITQMDGFFELYKGDNTTNFGVAKFDLTTMLDDSGECITGTFNYATSLFECTTIENYIAVYKEILRQLSSLDLRNTKVSQLNYLPKAASEMIITEWNKTQKTYPSGKTINQLFEEQVERTPDNIALIYEDVHLTYRELNERANALASYLIHTYDILPDDLIAVCMSRSEHLLVTILGILKAGGAYVPMDPNAPDDRIMYMVADTKSKVVLIDNKQEKRLKEILTASVEVVDDQLLTKLKSNFSLKNVVNKTNSRNLAYVIYTSGTTGNPKGAMIEHESVANRIAWMNDEYPLKTTDKILQKTTYTFDVSVWELFWANWYGASIVFADSEEYKDNVYLLNLIRKEKITILHFVPSMLAAFEETLLSNEQLQPYTRSLRYLFCSGEALNLEEVRKFHQLVPNCEIHNLYGPTEATVDVLYYNCNDKNIPEVLIGRPIANTTAYVLSKDLQPLPVGAIGELYIGGVNVGRGYLNNLKLSAERFLSNPFQSIHEKQSGYNGSIYKTGDLVRYRLDGNIEYIGRNDFQVKIRGFRIELGEVETRMLSYPGIKQAVVLAKDHASGTKYMVGYYVSDREFDNDSIQALLQKDLPEYMVPSIFVHLTSLPLTANGKLDRKSLPEPKFTGKREYIAPENKIEEQLCEIYGSVLGLESSTISVENDFFKIGGDSISSIQLVNRIRQRLDIHLTVKDIFNNKTIRALYTNVISCAKSNRQEMQTEQGILSGDLGLLPIQQWFFSNLDKGLLPAYNHFNQAFIIKTPILDKTVLKLALQKLIEQHDGFRLAFKKSSAKGEYQQYYQDSLPNFELDCVNIKDFSAREIETMMTDWQSSFDIFDNNLFHVGYLEGYDDQSASIHFALHHLIVDGVSWRLIKNDLETIYKYLIDKKDDAPVSTILGNKGSSYRQWVNTVSHYKEKDVASSKKETAYWKSITSGISASNELLASMKIDQLNQTDLILDVTTTDLLLRQIHNVYNTQINDVLLTALSRALTTLTNGSCHHILLEGHGRENISPDININNTIGWFTSMYPVFIDSKEVKPGAILSAVKDMLRDIPNNGIGYGALIGYTEQELPRITFNYLGQFDANSKTDTSWSFSDANSGVTISSKNKDHNILSINGGIIDGELRFSLTGYIESNKLADFAASFKSELTLLIDTLSKEKRSYLTLSDVDYIVSQSYLDKIQDKKEIEGIYLANSLQQGFIYHALNSHSEDDSYKIQLAWDYLNPLDIDLLKQAWILAQKKYPTLRLRFAWKEELIQIIDKEGSLNWIYKDISSMSIEEQDKFVEELITEDRALKYNLEKAQLFKVYLIKRNDTRYTCLLSNHHAILDGWSLPVLINYIHDSYLNLKKGNSIQVEEDSVYALAQQYLHSNKSENIQFWNQYLQLLESQEDLNSLLKPSQKHIKLSDYKQVLEPAEKSLYIQEDRYHKLKDLCTRNGFTFNALLQYCWHRQLKVYGHSDTTVVGMTVSGRNLPIEGVEDSVGLYINTLPVVFEHKDERVIDAVISLQNHIGNINSHSDISLIQLQKNGVRLFNSLFVFENFPLTNNGAEDELKMEIKYSKEKLDYPLGVSVFEQNQEISFKLQYAGELFSEQTIDQLLDGVSIILDQLLANDKIETKELKYLNQADTQKIVYDWNKTEKPYPSNYTLVQQFEEQVDKTPDNIAFVYKDIKLTYRKLNERANLLASYLMDTYNIRPDDMIALCLDKSEYMLIAMLGVMKSGAAYVPMDAGAPEDRIKYMVSDTSSKVLLTNKNHKQRLHDLLPLVPVEAVDDKTFIEDLSSNYSGVNPKTDLCANNLAYVIYTSGTTGNPKGVMLEHRGVVNLTTSIGDEMGLTTSSNKKCLWYASYIFDAHVFELYKAITSGNCIYLLEEERRRDIDLLSEYISEHGIEIATLPPVLLEKDFNLPLGTLVVAGEVTDPEVMDAYKTNNVTVINGYGPTEDTVCSTLHRYQIGDSNTNIGRPIANSTAYVLDKNMQPLPINAIGELYVGGAGVARGYLNNPELSSKQFVFNPFQSAENKKNRYNERIYKTGDLVRFDSNGDIEYIGRSDFQVKIRGFRIELGEIETRITSYPNVKKAVVLAKENTLGTKYLVAYYTSDQELDNNSIINYLESNLPEYMVPYVLIYLHDFPMTVNGKLNRRALPEPKFIEKRKYVAPENNIEKQLCEVFGEVLGLDPTTISVEDNFHKLGGNSILAIKLINKINNLLNSSIKLIDVLGSQSIRNLAILCVNRTYKPIVELNKSSDKEALIMIHPGMGGCDVYIPLATKFASHYHCYGIDSYNMYHDEKIDNLSQLADLYLEAIDNMLNKPASYKLFGWSLGGQIALEIASKLEKRGVKNITVYLLDTWMVNINTSETIDSEIDKFMKKFNIPKNEKDNIIRAMKEDEKLSAHPISEKLNYTNVLLFKAMNDVEDKIHQQYPYNNVDDSINNLALLNLVQIDSDHHSLLEHDIEILNNISKFTNK